MTKLFALLDLFRKGAIVTDPVLWKTRQVNANLLIPAIAALFATAKAFGYDVPISQEDIASLSIGLLAVINGLLTVTTTTKLGLPAKPEPLEPSDITGSHDAGFDADIFKNRG